MSRGTTDAGVRIERLVPADLDEILAIEEDLFGAERWTAGMFRNELDQGNYYLVARYLVARYPVVRDPVARDPVARDPVARDGQAGIVGYGGLAVLPPEEAWVNNLAVRRDAQRRGVGRALLAALLAEAQRRSVRRVLLEVAADNLPAQRLYAGYGFEAVSVRRGYYQPSNTDALVMRREQ